MNYCNRLHLNLQQLNFDCHNLFTISVRGKEIVNTVPFPCQLSTCMDPPNRSIISLHTLKPNPVPFSLVEKKGIYNIALASSDIPHPLSLMTIVANSF